MAVFAPPVNISALGVRLARQRKKPQRYTVAVFCGPDTRQRLLPLLPFGPDGVGSAAAVRLGKRLTRKGGKLSMVALAFHCFTARGEQCGGIAHDYYHFVVTQPAEGL